MKQLGKDVLIGQRFVK